MGNRIHRKHIFFLAALAVFASFGLYLWVKDTGRSLVNDELWTVYFSSTRHLKTAGEMFAYISRMPAVNPPLHPLIVRLWISLFGDSEISIRIPSILFAAASLFVMYRLVSKLLNGKTALAASLLLLFSYPFAYFADVARNYSLFFLLSLLSQYYFLLLTDGLRKRTALLYLLVTALLLYCHYFGLFFLPAQILYLAMKRKINWRWTVLFAGLSLLYLPWAPSFFYHAQRLRFGSWVPRTDVIEGIRQMLVFFGIAGWGRLNIIPIAAVAAGLAAAFRHYRNQALLLTVWLFVPIAIPLLVSQFTQPFFVTRFMLPTLAPLVIIYALGLCEYIKNRVVLAAAVTVLAFFTALPAPGAPPPLEHEDWKSAFAIIARQKYPAVLYPVSTATRMAAEYYGQPNKLITEAVLDKTCPPAVYVLSRYENYRLRSGCGYALEKKYLDLAPYVFEYRKN